MINIEQVQQANRKWFGDGNAKFFGDKEYRVLQSHSHKAFLVRATTAWTDMFGGSKILHYRINAIDQNTLRILSLTDDVFDSPDDAKQWLREN